MNDSNSMATGGAGQQGGAPSKTASVFRSFKNLFGFLAIVTSWWAAILTIMLGQSIVILLNADGYKPGTFTIEKLVYFDPAYRGRSRPDKYWAEGKVDGQAETFFLGGYAEGVIQNLEELEAQFSVGQQLPVLYNPDAPENSEIRVLFPDENFREAWQRRRMDFLKTGYLPLCLCITLCLVSGVLARKTKSAIGFSVASMFFVVFAWVFIWLKWFA